MSCKCKGSQCGARVISSDNSVSVLERPACTFDLSVPGAPAFVTPFRMLGVPTDSTSSLVFTDLLVVPGGVTVVSPGDILLDFDAGPILNPPVGTVTAQGVNFQFLWDGAPLPDFGFNVFDAGNVGTQFDSFGIPVRFRSLIVGATPGVHTLSVQWSVDDAASLGSVFAGGGNLTIQSAPR